MSSTENNFPSIDRNQWESLVASTLKDDDPQSLNRLDEDGLEIEALYSIKSLDQRSDTSFPITRLPVDPMAHMAHGWDICQPVNAAGPAEETNRLILDELGDGVGSIWLEDLPTGDLATNLPVMMQDIILSAAGVNLDAGDNTMLHLAGFSDFAKSRGQRLSELRVFANLDPFSPDAALSFLDHGLNYLATADGEDIPLGLFRANGWGWHNRGMTAVQELAYVLASLTEIMRQGMVNSLDLSDLASLLSASVALPADLFEGIAKCRALRRGWGGIVDAFGLDPNLHRLFLQGAVSVRMFSQIDADVNILRTTTALLGGAIGGADQLSAHAHDCLGGTSASGRRLARMQQHLLIEECGLSRSLDPAGGAGFIEARSNQLADAAWCMFQKMEADGGAKAACRSGLFDRLAKKSAGRRHARLADGNLNLVGVNLQPDRRPIVPSLSRWKSVRRPAAAIEAIRLSALQNPPRILLLQRGTDLSSQLVKLRTLLAIGGVQPVQMRPIDINEQTIANSRPNLIILADSDFEALAASTQGHLKNLQEKGKVMSAKTLLNAPAPLEVLANMVNVCLLPYRNGEV
ncbi:methylmalonyl-CoA mutase family protein [Candidatus Puniceispirillum sp.]|nr:methylmalonyl-CoA mutase family protein [Candidatus Puniceispirillum sp.]